MTTQLFLLTLLSVSFLFADAATADEPLVKFDEGRTHVNCEFANHALAEGYFGKIINPRITGTCPEALPGIATEAIVGKPILGGPPIAPWCDCTDEELKEIQSLMAEQNIFINPGFGSANAVADWAKAFNTDTTTIRSSDFWVNGQVPAFEELSKRRFLEQK